MKENRHIIKILREAGSTLEIPERLMPEQMQKTIEESKICSKKQQVLKRRRLHLRLASAACFFLAAGLLLQLYQTEKDSFGKGTVRAELLEAGTAKGSVLAEVPETEQDLPELSGSTYEEIYACLSANWQEQKERMNSGTSGYDRNNVEDLAVSEQKLQDTVVFGQTNLQVNQVDEGDQIKNDGRYLYQIARRPQEGQEDRVGIQILDTEGGLKETAFVDGFTSIEEFYIWEDLLIIVENKHYNHVSLLPEQKSAAERKDIFICGAVEREQGYHEISIYQMTDKSRPRKQKTFTLQGTYKSSRISEGYFYGISRFSAGPGEGVQDYGAYIPSIDGKRLEAERIYCPPDTDSTDYLVLVSVDLSDPSSILDSRAVVGGFDTYYVSAHNIYMVRYHSVYEAEPKAAGRVQDRTALLKFSYRKGRFYAQAQGEIPGRVEDRFSMDEYGGNLRLAVTVQEYEAKEIKDDRTMERLGFDYTQKAQTNALYVLDASLKIKGKIEGLAENENIRSARFLGDIGYFVTFRQTDPLFAVDLSNPEEPQILGELKVSGFSEYLHFYEEDLLLGIGMEADEQTGEEQGMKLSMFDISDPAGMKEISRFSLKEYNYSEALWDHRAVLIDPAENIIGFPAGGRSGQEYVLFSYKDGTFVQELKIDTQSKDGVNVKVRGTFIGEVFYLLFENGTVRAYDRQTGELLEELRLEKENG